MTGYRRREVLAGLGTLALAGVLAACSAQPAPARTTPPSRPRTTPPGPSPTATASPTPGTPGTEPDVEVMVGQMLLLGFRGTTAADATCLADIRERHLGGVVVFAKDVPSGGGTRNVESPDQLAALCAALQAEAERPLLITTDQEGGRVARLGPDHGFPTTPSAADLGAGDPAATREAAAAMARTLRAAGITLNLAPVVDVNTNPANPIIGALDRSFSADPAVVTAQAEAFVRGHHDVGILTTLKHFPGHGSSTGDTHAGLVDVTDTWQSLELDPYRALVRDGLADAVMVAHVINGQIDPDRPASLSALTIDGLLRDDIGFDGVVVSDDLQMGAITQQWGFEDALRLAVQAGADLLTYGNNLDTFDADVGRRAYDALLGHVRSGAISEDRVAASYRRIAALTWRMPGGGAATP